MLHALKRHPDSVGTSVTRIDASVTRQAASLMLRYVVYGNIAALSIPARASADRGDQLWQHTCCEAFIRADDARYYEFNLSPSTQWAAYRFASYREGMAQAQCTAPTITTITDAERFELQAVIDCTRTTLPNTLWRVGLSAVIEERSGGKSYWALAHTPGKPDFHHADGFVITLEP